MMIRISLLLTLSLINTVLVSGNNSTLCSDYGLAPGPTFDDDCLNHCEMVEMSTTAGNPKDFRLGPTSLDSNVYRNVECTCTSGFACTEEIAVFDNDAHDGSASCPSYDIRVEADCSNFCSPIDPIRYEADVLPVNGVVSCKCGLGVTICVGGAETELQDTQLCSAVDLNPSVTFEQDCIDFCTDEQDSTNVSVPFDFRTGPTETDTQVYRQTSCNCTSGFTCYERQAVFDVEGYDGTIPCDDLNVTSITTCEAYCKMIDPTRFDVSALPGGGLESCSCGLGLVVCGASAAATGTNHLLVVQLWTMFCVAITFVSMAVIL